MPSRRARRAASDCCCSIRRLAACMRLPCAEVNLATRGPGPAPEERASMARAIERSQEPADGGLGRRRRAVGACCECACSGCASVRAMSAHATPRAHDSAVARSPGRQVARSREWMRAHYGVRRKRRVPTVIRRQATRLRSRRASLQHAVALLPAGRRHSPASSAASHGGPDAAARSCIVASRLSRSRRRGR